MKLLEKLIATKNGTLEREYAVAVSRKIRTRYTVSDELALLRRRDEDPEAFAAYHAFAESAKAEARAEILDGEASDA